ncbi:MAG: hypothetical protein BGP05_14790 [Rhizobiales bacterium 62-47]|nr:MAG: hypothetical protein BGP05_14790 [Rhizobiales bacterium 62-47]
MKTWMAGMNPTMTNSLPRFIELFLVDFEVRARAAAKADFTNGLHNDLAPSPFEARLHSHFRLTAVQQEGWGQD